jgi:N-acetylglucosaminyldiphosphoundecaprenol N-acetyl-beta-D-mannosaminyltransferase
MALLDKRRKICGIPCDTLTYINAVDIIDSIARSEYSKCHTVYTPNTQHIHLYHSNEAFKIAYDNSDLSLIDGAPLHWTAKLFHPGKWDKISGSDLFVSIMQSAKARQIRVFLLGGQDDDWRKVFAHFIGSDFSEQDYKGLPPDFGFEKDEIKNHAILSQINLFKPDILFVAVGAPKQELWIANNKDLLEAKLAMGVGASLDFITGKQNRAPVWMQKTGLEWVYRLYHDPKRLFIRYVQAGFAFLIGFFIDLRIWLFDKK